MYARKSECKGKQREEAEGNYTLLQLPCVLPFLQILSDHTVTNSPFRGTEGIFGRQDFENLRSAVDYFSLMTYDYSSRRM